MKNKTSILSAILLTASLTFGCTENAEQKENVQNIEHSSAIIKEITESVSNIQNNSNMADIEFGVAKNTDTLEIDGEKVSSNISEKDLAAEKELLKLIKELPEKVSPPWRSEEYNDPILTEELIFELLEDAKNAESLILSFGIQVPYFETKWRNNSSTWVHSTEHTKAPYGNYIYCAPALDTEKEFDEYFSHFFTEETLNYYKKQYVINVNGRLAVIDRNQEDHAELDSIGKIIYNDDGTATVIATEYMVKGGKYRQSKHTFAFSTKYGWLYHNQAAEKIQSLDNASAEAVINNGSPRETADAVITQGNGYSTDAEDFPITDFLKDKTDTRHLKKMPIHPRPEGYNNPSLSFKTALEILAETRKALMYAYLSGAPHFAVTEWANDKNNFIEERIETEYEDTYFYRKYYFVPPLDTLEEFEKYFLPILGEAYIEDAKKHTLKQQEDGRITAFNSPDFFGYLLADYWDIAEILFVEQVPGSNEAIATFKLTNIPNNEYDSDFEHSFEKRVKFVFTQKYGWQLKYSEDTYIWLN